MGACFPIGSILRIKKMLCKTFVILALAVMATAMPSERVPEESATADVVTGYSTTEQYGMAKAAVTALLQEGKDDSACRDLAKTTADEVTDSVASQQKTLEALPNGDQCNGEGQDLIDNANKAHDDAKKAKDDAATALSKAQDEKFNFGDFSYTQLTEGQCGIFFNSAVWKNAKSKVQAAQTAFNNAASAVTVAKNNVDAAKKQAESLVKKCKCDTKKTIDSTLESMNTNSKAANQAAWNKAYHMQCVLDGKTTNQCNVPALPVVKAVPYGAGVKNACGEDMWASKGSNMKSQRGYYFKLFKMPAASGMPENSHGQSVYENICKNAGLKMVGCGTNSFPSQNYPSRAVAMPSNWGCNMMNSIKTYTKFCTDHNCLALQEYPDSHAWLYTNGPYNSQHSNAGTTYYPVCGCEVGYDSGCDSKTL